MYASINIDKFEGLNSSAAPELISDGQARDILNFRMEKVGKLVSRNGYIIGLFTDPRTAGYTLATRNETYINAPVPCFMVNGGIIGIGELTLEEKWDLIDTDKLMVYVIRGEESNVIDESTASGVHPKRHKECYLFSPITGKYKNALLVGGNGPAAININTKRMKEPQGYNGSETDYDKWHEVVLFAPNRYLPTDKETIENNDLWRNHYVDINQYRHQLIISDRINGDMRIADIYSDIPAQSCKEKEHRLYLAPNCLSLFDIDIVILDPRFGEKEKNDIKAGVENGMALYKYKAQKSIMQKSMDRWRGRISEPSSYLDLKNPMKDLERIKKIMASENTDTLITLFDFNRILLCKTHRLDDEVIITNDIIIKNNIRRQYVYTNATEATEYDDLLKPVILEEEEVISDEGKVEKEYSANVYIWDDYRIKYYPCSGKEIITQNDQVLDYTYYLKAIDREFTKITSGPKITKLQTKKNAGKHAPLGVWRYRFVWDYGDGVYSAPSTELLCPDIMWSATTDDEIRSKREGIGVKVPYVRKKNNEEKQFYKQPTPTNVLYPATSYPLIEWELAPALVKEDSTLTSYGEKYFWLKHKIYGGINHRYGVKNYDKILDIEAANPQAKGDVFVNMTLFFSESNLELYGWVWEGVAVNLQDNYVEQSAEWIKVVNDKITPNKGCVVVPIFQNYSQTYTHNSVFDDEGRYRLSYVSSAFNRPKKMLVFPCHTFGVGINHTVENAIHYEDDYDYESTIDIKNFQIFTGLYSYYNGHEPNLYLNIVCDDIDKNNDPDDVDLRIYRPQNRMRARRREEDSLIWVKEGMPSQVIDRLLLQGIAGLEIVSYGDRLVIDSAKMGLDNQYDIYPRDFIRNWSLIKCYKIQIRPVDPPNYKSYPYYIYGEGDNSFPQNVKIIIYGQGERYLGDEQLTAYFPSSLLFNSPRMAIKIPYDKVPNKAKRLLIFRTKSSHSNDYNPNEYGLVETVEIKRWLEEDTIAYGSEIYKEGDAYSEIDGVDNLKMKQGEQKNLYHGIYYFDDKKDNELAFGVSPEEYEGLTKPLKSRFNITLNERVYYLNFEQEYQPKEPRKSEYDEEEKDITASTNLMVYNSIDEKGFDKDEYFYYLYVYKDKLNVRSKAKRTSMIYVDGKVNKKRVVILFLMPSSYNYSIEYVEVYRAKAKGPEGNMLSEQELEFYYIGKIENNDEGVFVDDGLINQHKLPCLDPEIYDYESGMMWSEPYRPDWIKATSLAEYRSGDGMQITGVESLYGNLVIFKETSAHRVQIQGVEPPITRTDEITPELGCIAPMTLINRDGIIYYLSWKGFIKYDNNQFQKIDGPFDEELQYILQNSPIEAIRDASCGYNPAYNEIYLNIPMLNSKTADGRQCEYGKGSMYQFGENNISPIYYQRTILGHIYVINIEKQYATKFAYQASIPDRASWNNINQLYEKWYKEVIDTRQLIRMYYTNSQGELRSGDILASGYNANGFAEAGTSGYNWAGIYIETPYNINEGYYIGNEWYSLRQKAFGQHSSSEVIELTDYDDFFFAEAVTLNRIPQFIITSVFPPIGIYPVKSVYKSKFFTGDRETMIKRVRKVLINIFSRGGTIVRGISIPMLNEYISGDYNLGLNTTFGKIADERIENLTMASMGDIENQKYVFGPSVNTNIIYGRTTIMPIFGLGSNIISIIPRHPEIEAMDMQNDWYGKPIRFSVEIESELRTQINSVNIYWRPIHTYLT